MKKFFMSVLFLLISFHCLAQQYAYKNKKYDSLEKKEKYNEILLDIQSRDSSTYTASDYYYLGVAYFRLENDEEAQKNFKIAINKEPTFLSAYDYLAGSYYFSGNFDSAITCFKKCIKIDPTYTRPYEMLGDIYRNSKKYDKALKYYKKLYDVKKTKESTYYMAYIYYEMKEYAKAKPFVIDYLKYDSKSFSMTNLMVYILNLEGQFTEAAKYEKQLTKIWTSSKDASIKKQGFYIAYSFSHKNLEIDVYKKFEQKGNFYYPITCNIKKDGIVTATVNIEYDEISKGFGTPYLVGMDELETGIHYATGIALKKLPELPELLKIVVDSLEGNIEIRASGKTVGTAAN